MKYILGLVFLMVSSVSHAFLLVNFSDLADGITHTSDGTGATGESGYASYEFLFNTGLELDVLGYEKSGVQSSAYMDHKSGGAQGGMGVCTVLSSSKQCKPSSDDNVSKDEFLRLLFSEDVLIESLTFNNNHDGGFNNSKIGINGVTTLMGNTSGKDTAFTVDTGWLISAGVPFDLSYIDRRGRKANLNQFYLQQIVVSKAVPEPSIIALFALGLIGLVYAGKRKLG